MGELILRDTVTNIVDVNNMTKNTNNPATSYLLRLRSKQSQKTMRSCLVSVVKLFRSTTHSRLTYPLWIGILSNWYFRS